METAEPGLFDVPGDRDAIRQKLEAAIRQLTAEGYTSFLCGMAEGFDLLAGDAVLSLRREFPRIRLTAVVPFAGQATGFSADVREAYERVMAGADEIFTVCPHYSTDCFHRRNDYMVGHSSVLVCCYNGSAGGTQYTVKRALKNGLRVINLL